VNDVHELYLTQVWLRHHFKSNKSKHENRIPVLRAYVYRDGWVLGRPLFLLFTFWKPPNKFTPPPLQSEEQKWNSLAFVISTRITNLVFS